MDHTNSWSSADIHHTCNACGRCCDSGPSLSLRELLTHEQTLIGCLAVRKVPRINVGDAITEHHRATLTDALEAQRLAESLFFQPQSGASYDIELALQSFSYASLSTCPALTPDLRCSLHGPDKPSSCQCVPFDPALPDTLQRWVLAARGQEAHAWGAECITVDPPSAPTPVVSRLRVLHPHSLTLAAWRQERIADRILWGNAVFAHLNRALASTHFSAVPTRGFLLLSPVVVLTHLARSGTDAQRRVRQFLSAQSILIAETLKTALQRKDRADRADTQLLRTLLAKNDQLRGLLESQSSVIREGCPSPAQGGAAGLER